MTEDQILLYDTYQYLIQQAVIAETEAAAAMSTYQIQTNIAKDYRAQAKDYAARLGITTI